MKQIPNRLECAYCIRNSDRGGECSSRLYSEKQHSDLQGCLAFKADERGCIRNSDFKISVPLYNAFPFTNAWSTDWLVDGKDSPVRIRIIYGLTWDTRSGNILVHCNCDYFVNEFADDYKCGNKKPMLKLVKG